jgi:3-oxoacyl-[acyl-carrier protein] reductase
MLYEYSEEALKELKNSTPLGRLGEPYDIAAAICFLASDGADFITGQVISPNGGFVI